MPFIRTYPCGKCDTPLEVQVEEMLRFPDDGRVLLDSIAIKPLAIECPVCKTPSLTAPSVVIVDAENQRAIVNGREDDLRITTEQAIAEAGLSLEITYCPEYSDMWAVLVEWAGEHVSQALLPVLRDGVEAQTDSDGQPLYLSYFVLLALSHAVDLHMPFGITTDPPLPEEERRSLARDMLIDLSTEALKAAYKIAFHSDIAALAAVVERRMPREALRPETLQRLVDECSPRDSILEDFSLLDKAFRFEYLTAVAHRHAALSNPRESEWCRLMMMVVYFFEAGMPRRTEEQFLLTPAALRQTISFPRFYEVLAHDLGLSEEQPDPERTRLAERIATRFGYHDEAAQAFGTRIRIFDAMRGSDEELADQFKEGVIEAMARDHGRGQALHAGRHVAETLIVNKRPGAALLVAIHALESFADSDEDFVYALCRTCEIFNDLRAHDQTAELLNRCHPRVAPILLELPAKRAVDYLNERANTLRYLQQPAAAIGLYRHALDVAGTGAELEDERRTLFRNIAIALREDDRPAASRRNLLALLSDAASEAERGQLRQNLISTLFALRAYSEALPYAQENFSAASGGADLRGRLLAVLQLVIAKASTRTPLDGELGLAHRLLVVAPAMAPSVAAATFLAARNLEVEQQTIDAAAEIIGRLELDGPVEHTALVSYAEWQVDRGDVAGAHATMSRLIESFGDDLSMPWQWEYFLYRLHQDEPFEQRWPRLRRALMNLDSDLPIDTAGLALATWLNETDALLRDLVPSVKEAYRRGIADANDLLAVANMAGGRDVVRRTSGETPAGAELPRGTIVAFLEDDQDIWCLTCRFDGSDPIVTSLTLDAAETRALSVRFHRSIQRALPHRRSRGETAIEPLLQRIGTAVAAAVGPGDHVCFVPSPSLLAIPLNACRVDDGTLLLARTTISVAANVSLVANLLRDARPLELNSASVIAVSKRGDSTEFRERLAAASTALFDLLGGAGEHLHEIAADKSSCLAAIERSDLAVLLCHGADAGPSYGRGFCVSDGRDLPPPLLPLTEAPALRRFIVDATDVETLDRAPAFVSTIACSSGLAIAGRGGTRAGIERSLFMNGTQTMIAPLWDVAQTEALQFILDFHRLCGEHPDWDYARAYQAAALLAYDRSPNLFDWAPMQLRGNWRRTGGSNR